MRIIAIDQTDGALRVAYRWTNSVFEQPRLLINGSNLPLADLRRVIERDHLGGPMSANEYQVVALVADLTALEAVRAAFADLDVIGLFPDDPQLGFLMYGSYHVASAPEARVLSLSYYGADQITFADGLDQLERGFLHWESYASALDTFRSDFHALRESMRIVLIGRSVHALRESYQQLTGEALWAPSFPDKVVIAETHYQGLPLTVIDGRAVADIESIAPQLALPIMVIIAVASDPGLGAAEMAIINQIPLVSVAVVNTHSDPADYATIYAYLRATVLPPAEVLEAAGLEPNIRLSLGDLIGSRLRDWYYTHFPFEAYPHFPSELQQAFMVAQHLIATTFPID